MTSFLFEDMIPASEVEEIDKEAFRTGVILGMCLGVVLMFGVITMQVLGVIP